MSPWPDKLPRWMAPALFAIALAGALWRAPVAEAPAFVPPPAATPSMLPALFASEFLPATDAMAQSPSLTQLPDGRIAAAWLAGKPQNADEASIWLSLLGRDGWSKPQQIASRESTAAGTLAYLRQIGSPVIYAEGGWLHLWYASIAIGDQGGSSLNHSISTDNGASWRKPVKLSTSPLANISTQPSATPLPLADGGLGLPIYHDFVARQSEWLRLSATGRILDKARLPANGPTLQPSVTAFDAQHAIALLRDAGTSPGKVQQAGTDNGGLNWQAAEALTVPNPNTPVAVLRLKSGRLLLAGNPANGRQTLQLWLSADAGKTWQDSRVIETAPDGGADFSSPNLLLGRDGRIHLAYTWRQQGIKHAAFSEAWLDGGQP
jgi:predicted neuraminidase